MKRVSVLIMLFPMVLLGAACELQKSENPLSPSVAGPIAGVEISAPKTLEPGTGWQISGERQPITLLLENASSNGQRPLSYLFEVATDAGFTNKVFVRDGVTAGDGGRTSLRLPDALAAGRSYYWRAKAEDGANTGPYSSPAAFNLFMPLSFNQPVAISPVNNEKTASQLPEFRWSNAARTGTPNSVGYTLEVATSDSFASPIVGWQLDENPSGQTTFTAVTGLPGNAQLFWRVRAQDSATLGPWSNTAVFRTPAPVVVVPPPTGPGPTVPGAPCASATTHLGVVECRRKTFGTHMSDAELLVFMKALAHDLNQAGLSGGPYGILRKTTGVQCGGWSCDVICAGSGTSQKQWDVLSDSHGAQNPAWSGPLTYPGIRIDTCEVQ